MKTKRKNITLTDKTVENLEYLSARLDITNHSDIMRSALQYYVDDIRKQESKISLYTKKQPTQQKEKESVDTNAEMKMLCNTHFDGVVVDKDGVENEYGQYCKYTSYQKLSENIISKDTKIQSLDLLGDFVNGIYIDTSKKEVENFDGKLI